MAKLELYPQDLIFELTAKDLTGAVVDLTQYVNYQCTVFSQISTIQKFSKLERDGFSDIIPVEEVDGVFRIKIKRENLLTATAGNVMCIINATTEDEDFTESLDLDVGTAIYLFTLIKNIYIDGKNI